VENEIGRACGMNGRKKKGQCIQGFGGVSEGKRPLGRPNIT
jgi:hypothetical protein